MNFMRRTSYFAFLAFLAFSLLGCAGQELQRTEGYIRPAQSGNVRVYIPSNLPIKIYVISSGRYAPPPVIDDNYRVYASKEMRKMFQSMEEQLNARFSQALTQSQLLPGDDLVLAIDVEEGVYMSGPGAKINVRAVYKNSPKNVPVWSFKFSAAAGTFENPETAAKKFVDKIMNEVEATGMLRRK